MHPIWRLVHHERTGLISFLEDLEPSDWEVQSLCPGWSVRDVAAHLVDNARTTTPRLLLAMARAGFDFDRQNAQGVDRERGSDPHETLERLRRVAERTSGPPAPLASRLVEEVVHGEDIRRPLRATGTYHAEAVSLALNHQLRTGVGWGGGRERMAGLRLEASDTDQSWGPQTGPPVTGSAVDVLMVASGRWAVLSQLFGPGVDLLEERRGEC